MFTPTATARSSIGLVVHLVNGWVFAIVYALFFENIHVATWWFGALIGAVQGLFVVVVLLPVLPGIHPRMVSDSAVPSRRACSSRRDSWRTNYGRSTPRC